MAFDPEKVEQYLKDLDASLREIVLYLRALFLSEEEVSEHIKWNSVAFYFNASMAEFDAKEYKRDLAVINLHRGKILLVFPTGNKIPDDVLAGKNYADGRKIVEIANMESAQNLSGKLRSGVKYWLSQVER